MKSYWIGSALVAATLIIAPPAEAGTSRDFSGCDGLKKPKRKDDGMRGQATQTGTRRLPQTNLADQIVHFCGNALSSDKLRPEQTLRRAHLLRSRAAAYIELKQADAALADLDAAEAAASSYNGRFFYDRSMGLSLTLLRAMALSELGRADEAVTLLGQIAYQRPYSLEVQRGIAAIQIAASQSGALDHWETDVWKRIDPISRGFVTHKYRKNNDFVSMATNAGGQIPQLSPLPFFDLQTLAKAVTGQTAKWTLAEWTSDLENALELAYAYAVVGEADLSRQVLDNVRFALEVPEDKTRNRLGDEFFEKLASSTMEKLVHPTSQLIDGRLALLDGRISDAVTALNGLELQESTRTREFYSAYDAARANSVGQFPDLPPLLPRKKRKKSDISKLAREMLFAFESERTLIDYERSRANVLASIASAAVSFGASLLGGVNRTNGFQSTENFDGTITVEYTGETTSASVVQEMTILRAAELTHEAGAKAFVVDRRQDFQRHRVTSQYGRELSRTRVGSLSKITIRILHDVAGVSNSIDAVEVIDRLGPIYYGEES